MSQEPSINSTIEILKRYLNLRIEHAKLLGTEKLSIILSASVLLLLAILLGAIAIGYFSLALIHLLEIYVGIIAAYAILGGVMLLLLLLLYLLRRRWILDPITRFLARVLLNDNDDNNEI